MDFRMTLAVYGQLQVVDAMDTYMAAMLEQTIDIKKIATLYYTLYLSTL